MGSKLTSGAEAISQPLFASSATKQMSLGARVHSDDGRAFRYVLAGAVALVPGKLQQGPAVVANHQNMTCAVAAIGATSLTVTLGATAATKDQYAGGTVVINDVAGEGHTYLIKSHPAAASAATLAFELEDPIVVATTTSSQASAMANLYNGVIVAPTTATNAIVGVGIYPVPAGEYGFIQVEGPVSCLAGGAIGVGLGIGRSGVVAGAAVVMAATLTDLGSAAQAGVDTEYRLVNLRIS